MAARARPAPRVPVAIAACCGVWLAVARGAVADETPSLALDPAPAGDRGLAVERAAVRGHLLPSARLLIDYASEPLVLTNAAQELDAVVSYQVWAHAMGSFSIAHRFLVAADLPFVLAQGSSPVPASGATATRASSGFELGDLRLGVRARLLGSVEDADVQIGTALTASLWLPTAMDGHAGDGSLRGGAGLVLEAEAKRVYGALTGGFRSRPAEVLPGALPTRVGTSISMGIAAGFFADARREMAIGVEVPAESTIGAGAKLFDPRASVGHVLLTGRYRVAGGPLELAAAFGPGVGSGAGSADYRMVLFAGFSPETAPPPADADEDGIPDKNDACFDLDGVPSPDPLLHGCPEAPPDRDGDAIPDENDACPTVAGEPTGARKTHGCPRPVDTDADGVVDAADRCPREPGEPPPGDGCPKPPEPKTKLVAQEIVLSQQVQFETDTAVLRPESDGVLGEVARVLGEHPEAELVEVQGHTDDTGSAERNRRLAQDRADSVVEWLVRRGVARQRLTAKGYGADIPIADNTTEEGRTKNRRVAFRVLRTRPDAPAPEGQP